MLVETISAIGAAVTGALRQAAEATGTGFSYLLATARIESGLDPNVKSATSSATGLFQFIEQTWLMTMKQAGPELGYGRYAAAIEKTPSGRYTVSDPAMRAEILNLRKDPAANAAMAGALTRYNAARLKTKLGREASDGELYMAHFLGAGGAARLIDATDKRPQVAAAQLFPRAAAANRAIFYDGKGNARSVTQVYALLATKLASAKPAPRPAQGANAAVNVEPVRQVAAVLRPDSNPAIAARPLTTSVPPLIAAQAEAPEKSATASEPRPPLAFAPDGPPVFHDLFRTEGRSGVSQAVSELWGASSTGGGAPERRAGFDLFRSLPAGGQTVVPRAGD